METEQKFECQECGMLVYPTEFHNYESCQKFKLARRLTSLSELQERLNNKCSFDKLNDNNCKEVA